MSISYISPLTAPSAFFDQCLRANTSEGNGYLPTAFKVESVIAGIIASIVCFALLGSLIKIVSTLISGAILLMIFNSCIRNPPNHDPWYQRVFSYISTTIPYTSMNG